MHAQPGKAHFLPRPLFVFSENDVRCNAGMQKSTIVRNLRDINGRHRSFSISIFHGFTVVYLLRVSQLAFPESANGQ